MCRSPRGHETRYRCEPGAGSFCKSAALAPAVSVRANAARRLDATCRNGTPFSHGQKAPGFFKRRESFSGGHIQPSCAAQLSHPCHIDPPGAAFEDNCDKAAGEWRALRDSNS